jgi:hypothetical protein
MPSFSTSAPPKAQMQANTKYISNSAWSALLLRFSGLSTPSRMFTSVVTKFMVPRGVMWL